jgi:hypothetical protein
VDSSLMPSACSACANSRMPVLSETEIKAFMGFFGVGVQLRISPKTGSGSQ